MAKKKSRVPRGARGAQRGPSAASRPCHDLNVAFPASDLLQRQLLDRLGSTGFSVIAFSHTVYGKLDPENDSAEGAIPILSGATGDGSDISSVGTKRKRHHSTAAPPVPMTSQRSAKVIRRLNVVVEELSDVGHYATPESTMPANDPLRSYDLVAISPRSEPTFRAACSSAVNAEIIMLDYTSGRGGVQLPYKVRTSDLQVLVSRGGVVELNYGIAILDPSKRRAFIQASRELQGACLGIRPAPKIILSSGPRKLAGRDMGAMALRSPGDLVNLMRTVQGFDDRVSHHAMCQAGAEAVASGRKRRFGCDLVGGSKGSGRGVDVFVESFQGGEKSVVTSTDSLHQWEITSKPAKPTEKEVEGDVEDNELEDGFITLT